MLRGKEHYCIIKFEKNKDMMKKPIRQIPWKKKLPSKLTMVHLKVCINSMKNTQNNTHDWKVDSLNQDNLSKKKAIFLEDLQWLLRSLDFDFFRSHQRCSIEKAFLKIKKKKHKKTLVLEPPFLTKLKVDSCNFINQSDSGIGVFLWIFRNF